MYEGHTSSEIMDGLSCKCKGRLKCETDCSCAKADLQCTEDCSCKASAVCHNKVVEELADEL